MFKKEGMVSKIVGVVLLVVIVVLVIVIKNGNFTNKVDEIYGAVGGGKEDLLADEEINKIFAKKYKVFAGTSTFFSSVQSEGRETIR